VAHDERTEAGRQPPRGGAGASARAEHKRVAASARRAQVLRRVLVAVAAAVALVALSGPRWLLVLAAATAAAAWRCRPDPDPERWLRASAAEQATAELLAGLPSRRWAVRHDLALPRSRANVDHLVVGPTGVWVVDTKVSRAPLRVRRRRVWAGDHPIGTDAAAWEAERVEEVLGVPVRALVAVHGDGLRRRGVRAGTVRVVPAGQAVRRIRRGRRVLGRAEVSDLAALVDEVLPGYQ